MPTLQTPHLYMVSLTSGLIQAMMHSLEELEKQLSCQAAPGWPSLDYKSVLPLKEKQLEEDPEAGKWGGLIIHRAQNTIIGNMGLKAGPNETGTASLGYSIVPQYRGRGYATEMAAALISWAFTQPGVKRITAECLKENAASIRVLEKIGMRRVCEHDSTLYWVKESSLQQI